MKCEDVYKSIRMFISNHDFQLENVYVHAWEADLFSVTSSKYTYEIEVKVSRSDFFADKKKPKHGLFKMYKKGWGILRGDESWSGSYKGMVEDRIYYTNITPLKLGGGNCPNKFFYACPVGLIEAHEVPEYAGLIYVMDSGSYRVIKNCPFLHKDQFNHRDMLFDKYFYKWNSMKFENWELSQKIIRLENELKYLKAESPQITITI